MTTTPTIRVSDDSNRATIAAAIAALRGKQMRLPTHWATEREALGLEIDTLVERWLAAAA